MHCFYILNLICSDVIVFYTPKCIFDILSLYLVKCTSCTYLKKEGVFENIDGFLESYMQNM